MKKPILVIKFGSAAITTDGEIDERIVLEIARQCAQLQPKYNIVIVSSGAVAAGKKFIPKYTGTLAQKKAAAAIGNPLLVRTYGTYFKPFKIALAQSLCERHHFANRSQFLQLKSTYETLWKNNVIPIANENDVVSNKELKFSDNDELATLIAVGFGAEQIPHRQNDPHRKTKRRAADEFHPPALVEKGESGGPEIQRDQPGQRELIDGIDDILRIRNRQADDFGHGEP